MSTRTDAVVPLLSQRHLAPQASYEANANKLAGTYERGEMTFTASVMVDYDLAR